MTTDASKEDAAKQRIISHMNNDHHDSIIRYLEHYHKVKSIVAYDGRMTDLSLNELSIVCRGKSYTIPFNPPMSSLRETRERVVEMDKECVAALGRSDITINEFVPPHGPYLVLFGVVTATFAAYNPLSSFEPGSLLGSILPAGFCKFSTTIQPYLFWGMFAVHGAEALQFGRRLRKHNTNVRTLTYWTWMADCFIEGLGTFKRFDKLVAQKQAEKERQKH